MREPSSDLNDRNARLEAYWKENFRLIVILTVIWAVVTFAHPPFAAALNRITILTGFPLGMALAKPPRRARQRLA